MKKLTSKPFWQNYWKNNFKPVKVTPRAYFGKLLQTELQNSEKKQFIEIGGFPGYYAIYASKFMGMKSTMLDYYIDKRLLDVLLSHNGLDRGKISVIEADLFQYSSRKKYDLVFSSGLIEHFSNPSDVIGKHVRLMEKGGKLVITLPNFLGVNGFIQKVFDPEMLAAHNLNTMKLETLKKITKGPGLKNIKIFYYGYAGAWLENINTYPILVRLLVHGITALRIPISLVKYNSRLLSPHIVITAVKK